ncbi:b(0,+)-type amino acid transporter 1-like [Diadema setosum]|uniref:b(0,+)-type amino acid transporter 1-like n=1 Tax=Diadema setosum TaxID=31175 RepID=UPI003B3AEEE4
MAPPTPRGGDNSQKMVNDSGISNHESAPSYPVYRSEGGQPPRLDRSESKVSMKSDISRTDTLLSFQSTQNSPVVLRRKLGIVETVSLLIGVVIGTGIFVSPRGVLRYSGSPGASLLVWFFCGVIAFIGTVVFMELALMFPKAGGDHTYLHEGYGEVLAFLHGWGALLVARPMSLAIISIVVGEYMIFPYVNSVSDHLCLRDETAVKLHAATFIIFVMLLQASNLRVVARAQNIATVIKILTLLHIIALGLYDIAVDGPGYLAVDKSFEGSSTDVFSYGMAFYQGMFAFEGWNTLSYSMEEMKEPAKTLPRAIAIAMPTVTILYILTNIAYYSVLSPDVVLQSEAVALSFSAFHSQIFGWLTPFLICCAAFGTANGICYTFSRMTVALGREGHMPGVLGMVSPDTLSPNAALFLMCSLSLGMLLLPFSLEHQIEFFSFAIWISYTLIALAVIVLRVRKPEIPRPYKVNLALPVLLCVAGIFFILAPFVESRLVDVLGIVILIGSGLVAYFIFIFWEYRPSFMDTVTIYCQLFFNVTPSEYQPPPDMTTSDGSQVDKEEIKEKVGIDGSRRMSEEKQKILDKKEAK